MNQSGTVIKFSPNLPCLGIFFSIHIIDQHSVIITYANQASFYLLHFWIENSHQLNVELLLSKNLLTFLLFLFINNTILMT